MFHVNDHEGKNMGKIRPTLTCSHVSVLNRSTVTLQETPPGTYVPVTLTL